MKLTCLDWTSKNLPRAHYRQEVEELVHVGVEEGAGDADPQRDLHEDGRNERLNVFFLIRGPMFENHLNIERPY